MDLDCNNHSTCGDCLPCRPCLGAPERRPCPQVRRYGLVPVRSPCCNSTGPRRGAQGYGAETPCAGTLPYSLGPSRLPHRTRQGPRRIGLMRSRSARRKRAVPSYMSSSIALPHAARSPSGRPRCCIGRAMQGSSTSALDAGTCKVGHMRVGCITDAIPTCAYHCPRITRAVRWPEAGPVAR